MVAFTLVAPLAAQDNPPADLVKLVAQKESENAEARDHYTYRQTVVIEEFDKRGARDGVYREVRDVIFLPSGERSEKFIEGPVNYLNRLKLTPEDFRDIREVQPFLFTSDLLWLYETKFQGSETVEGIDCWVLRVTPRQTFEGMRLFDGTLWVDKKSLNTVRTFGRAVPEILNSKTENLFPQFATVRRPVDGTHWFPVETLADDVLPFRTGPLHMRMTIKYENYRRFGAESSVTFEEPGKNPPEH
jgi:hypothetical protein